jgi:hypothetical protein
MPEFSLAWNRRRLEWRRDRENSRWQLECVLCERMLLEGRPQLRIVARLAGIFEDEIDSPASQDQFWYDARRKLDKLRRLDHRDVWQIEIMLSKRVPKPQTVRSSSQSPRQSAAG